MKRTQLFETFFPIWAVTMLVLYGWFVILFRLRQGW